MTTYIKRNIPGHYVTLPAPLSPDLYSDLGKSWQDYLDGCWVPLSKKQVSFKEANPSASVKEVFEMKISVPEVHEPSIQEIKNRMMAEIDAYDNSEAVDSFTINGKSAWFTPQERNSYKQSVDSAKLLGVPDLSFFVGDFEFTVSTEKAEQMLAALQLYADKCFIVTKRHKLAVEALESIEAVMAYNFKTGYPERLQFTI